MLFRPIVCLFLLLCLFAQAAIATPRAVNIAVAANFKPVLQQLLLRPEAAALPATQLVVGSSGTLYAQIRHGAPLDLFFSADVDRPQQLIDDGLARADSLRIYALGRLAVYTPQSLVGDWREHVADWPRIALANPAVAPYGRAALQVLDTLPAASDIQSHLVYGNNVLQAYQYVASEHAQAGFLALSLLRGGAYTTQGTLWLIAATSHAPIEQAAVILQASPRAEQAAKVLDYVMSHAAQQHLQRQGYDSVELSQP